MESLKKIYEQCSKLVGEMPTSQRISLAVVPAMILIGFLMFGWNKSSRDLVPLSFGKAFSTDEVIHAEEAFREAGLTTYRREGALFYVPEEDVAKFHGALVARGALPAGFGDALEKQLEGGMGVFESSRSSQQRKEIALAKFLRQTLEAIPHVEFASVVWARSKATRWPHRGVAVTATVNVRPKSGHEFSNAQVRSFQTAVASMVPDLSPSQVTVFDMSTGISHTQDQLDEEIDGGLMKRIRDFSRDYETKISKALSYIPGVLVTVNVDVDQVKSRIDRIQQIDPKSTFKQFENTRSVTRDMENRYPRTEPGVRTNQPNNLSSNTGPTEKSNLSEEDSVSTSTPSFTVTEQEFFAAMPKAVQVSVKVPQTYFEAVAKQRGITAGESEEPDPEYERAIADIEQREIEKVKATATVLIPKGSDPASVDVSSFHGVRSDEADEGPSFLASSMALIENWAGKVGLIAFAAWGLWMVGKTLPAYPNEMPLEELAAKEKEAKEEEEKNKEPPVKKETSVRDALQSVVRDNPDITAGILEEWLQSQASS